MITNPPLMKGMNHKKSLLVFNRLTLFRLYESS
jgi:hypothetical protein